MASALSRRPWIWFPSHPVYNMTTWRIMHTQLFRDTSLKHFSLEYWNKEWSRTRRVNVLKSWTRIISGLYCNKSTLHHLKQHDKWFLLSYVFSTMHPNVQWTTFLWTCEFSFRHIGPPVHIANAIMCIFIWVAARYELANIVTAKFIISEASELVGIKSWYCKETDKDIHWTMHSLIPSFNDQRWQQWFVFTY